MPGTDFQLTTWERTFQGKSFDEWMKDTTSSYSTKRERVLQGVQILGGPFPAKVLSVLTLDFEESDAISATWPSRSCKFGPDAKGSLDGGQDTDVPGPR